MKKILRLLKDTVTLSRVFSPTEYLFCLYTLVVSVPAIIRTKKLSPFFRKFRGKVMRFKVGDTTVFLCGKQFGYANEIYNRKVYFTLPGFRIQKNDTVVDLGSDGGVFTVLAALLGGGVIAVEPNKESIKYLIQNAKKNNCLDKIKIYNGVVGSGSGVIKELEVRGVTDNSLNVQQFSMKQLIQENSIEKIDFLKVDIEGSEFDLFGHDLDWLKRVKRLAAEVHLNFGNPNSIKDKLEFYNFDVTLLNLDGKAVKKLDPPAGYLFAGNRSLQ